MKTRAFALAATLVLALTGVPALAQAADSDESTSFELPIIVHTLPAEDAAAPDSGQTQGTQPGGLQETGTAPLPHPFPATGDERLVYVVPFLLAALCGTAALLLLIRPHTRLRTAADEQPA